MSKEQKLQKSNIVSLSACPICGGASLPPKEPDAPFCSHRCALLDLGNWLSGDYRIASKSAPSEAGTGGEF